MTTIDSTTTTIERPAAGFDLDEAQLAAASFYDRRRQNFDRHAAYVVVAFVAGG